MEGKEMEKQRRESVPVVLVEVQPEAEEAQALVRAVDQQHQEMLDDALPGRRRWCERQGVL